MNKILKTILISSIAVFSVCLLFAESVQAQPADFVVEFEKGPLLPLFDQANFLPGESVSRWVKVTNNTGDSQKVGTRTSSSTDPYKLGDALYLQIKEGGITLSSSTLSDFFNAGVIYLSEVPTHSSTQYDFIITFMPEAGDDYQEKTLTFDFIVGRDIPDTTTTITTVSPLGPTGSYIPGQFAPPTGIVAGATTEQTTTTTLPGEGQGAGEVLGEATTTPTTTTVTTPLETTEETGLTGTQETGVVKPSQNWLWYLIGIIIIGGAVYLAYSRKNKRI